VAAAAAALRARVAASFSLSAMAEGVLNAYGEGLAALAGTARR